MLYNVNVYSVCRTRIENIEANSQTDACKIAEERMGNISGKDAKGNQIESADEIQSFLVDEVGDNEFSNSKSYDAKDIQS